MLHNRGLFARAKLYLNQTNNYLMILRDKLYITTQLCGDFKFSSNIMYSADVFQRATTQASAPRSSPTSTTTTRICVPSPPWFTSVTIHAVCVLQQRPHLPLVSIRLNPLLVHKYINTREYSVIMLVTYPYIATIGTIAAYGRRKRKFQ